MTGKGTATQVNVPGVTDREIRSGSEATWSKAILHERNEIETYENCIKAAQSRIAMYENFIQRRRELIEQDKKDGSDDHV